MGIDGGFVELEGTRAITLLTQVPKWYSCSCWSPRRDTQQRMGAAEDAFLFMEPHRKLYVHRKCRLECIGFRFKV